MVGVHLDPLSNLTLLFAFILMLYIVALSDTHMLQR